MNPPAGIHASQLRVEAQVRLGSFELATDLDLPLSGLTAVYGRSGSGKTTLINLVAGLLRPRTGRIAVGDVVYFDSALRLELPVEKRGLGYVFQDARLFPHLSVRSNLLFGLKRAAGHSGGPRAISVEQVVELLGIAALLDRRPHTLSGGEKQRVALGRALLAQPRLLLMDEPLASLDAPRKAEILPYIERLRDELQIPILYVSHAIDEVLRLATAIVVLDSGRVVAAGRLNEVLQQPEVRVQLGGTDFGTLAFGTVAAHDDAYGLSTLDCDGFELKVPRVPLAVGTKVRARIPAREVALALARPGDVSITNRLPGIVATVEPRDRTYSDVSVRLSPTTVLGVTITRESAARLALEPGLPVWCLIKSVALDAGALAIARGAAATRASVAANDALLNAPEPPPR